MNSILNTNFSYLKEPISGSVDMTLPEESPQRAEAVINHGLGMIPYYHIYLEISEDQVYRVPFLTVGAFFVQAWVDEQDLHILINHDPASPVEQTYTVRYYILVP